MTNQTLTILAAAAKNHLAPLFRAAEISIDSDPETAHVRIDLGEDCGLKLYGLIAQSHRAITADVADADESVAYVDLYVPTDNRIELIAREK